LLRRVERAFGQVQNGSEGFRKVQKAFGQVQKG
jgi:hypothetical protein